MVQKQQVYKSKTDMIDYNAGSQYKFISYEGRKIEILDKENNRIAFIKDIPDVVQIELISDTKAIMKSNRLMYAVYDVACMDFTWKYQYKPNPMMALSKFILAGSNILLEIMSTQLCKHSERIYKSQPAPQSKSSLPRITLQFG
ncbi:MAG: hypothetical protein ACI3XQ_00010 [Eubacteriales bacterium]